MQTIIYLLVSLLTILPNSPIAEILSKVEPYRLEFLQFVNWFIPFDFMVKTLQIWLVCVATYYTFRNASRPFKNIIK